MMGKIVFEGHIEEIADGIAYGIMEMKGGNGTRYTAQIPLKDFDGEVEEGTCFTLTEGSKNPVVLKLPPWTQEDIDKAEKWAEKISKSIKWE